MIKKTIAFVFLLILAFPVAAESLHLSVAASMTDLFTLLKTEFIKKHPGTKIYINSGASGALAQQISQGAPVDIFVSANPEWMEFLKKKQRMADASIIIFAGNKLVFAGLKKDGIVSLADLVKLNKIAIGTPESVPAGQYAKQALVAASLYEKLSAAGKLVLASDVRQALLYADRGSVDGAFVYSTDAALATRAVVLLQVPEMLYPKIVYPAGITAAGAKKKEAAEFMKFIRSSEAALILQKSGFIPFK